MKYRIDLLVRSNSPINGPWEPYLNPKRQEIILDTEHDAREFCNALHDVTGLNLSFMPVEHPAFLNLLEKEGDILYPRVIVHNTDKCLNSHCEFCALIQEVDNDTTDRHSPRL